MSKGNPIQFILKLAPKGKSGFQLNLPGNSVLVIRCAACKNKLWRYDKIGPGEVLRCHKARITRKYTFTARDQKIQCSCGKDIGIDKGSFIKMISKAFTYSGTKRSS